MKKIMKKALSLMLALVMMFSLAPMTAMAATGDEDTPAALPSVDGSTINTTLNDTYTNYYYEWTATADGVLTVEFDVDAAWGCEIINTTSGQREKQTSSYDGVSSAAIAVVEGSKYLIGVQDPNGGRTVAFAATFEAGAKLPGSEAGAAIDITSKLVSNPLGQGVKEYYVIKAEANQEYSVVVSSMSGVATVYVVGENNAETEVYADADTGVTTATITANAEGEIVFAIQNVGRAWNPAVFNVECIVAGEDVPPASTVGTMEDPYVVTELGEHEGSCAAGSYWCKWTATVAGVFTVTVDDTEPLAGVYTVNEGWDYVSKATDNAEAVEVVAGDVVLFYVRDFADSTVNFTTSFEAGATLPTDDENLEGEETEGPNYEWGNAIVVGSNEIAGPSYLCTYTVHEFSPMKVGKYTFTTTDSMMGIVSKNGYWITEKLPDAEYPDDNTVPYTAVTETEIVWECTDENQSIWIAVLPDAFNATIEVKWEDLEQVEYEKEEWPLFVSPNAYTFDGNEKDLVQLIYEMADGKVMYVMDDNGYFHVAPVKDIVSDDEALLGFSYNGDKDIEELPYVLVDLSDKVVSLQAALAERTFLVAEYDEEGNVIGIVDFTPALKEYLACADKGTGLYPLTFDLYTVFTVGGEAQGWYMNTESTTGIVATEYPEADGIDPVFLYTFAMYYLDQDITILDKEELVVDKAEMETIITNNAIQDTVINTTAKNEAGKDVAIKFEFAQGTMKPVDGKEEYTFEVSLVETYDKATSDKAEIKKEAFVLRINFEYDGKLPAEATITIPVGATYASKTLYYYQILADGTLKYVCDAPVDGDGNAKVTQDHCSDYVLLTEKIVEEAPEKSPAEAPDTGDSTNFILWITVLGLGVVAISGSVVMKKREF